MFNLSLNTDIATKTFIECEGQWTESTYVINIICIEILFEILRMGIVLSKL